MVRAGVGFVKGVLRGYEEDNGVPPAPEMGYTGGMRIFGFIFGCALLLPLALHAEEEPRPITRADAVRMLLLNRTEHIPLFPNKGQFPDVPQGDVNERYLLAAERYGIVRADPATGRLRPQSGINRAEFLKMLSLTYGLSEGLPYSFSDVRSHDWFAPYVGVSQIYGLLPSASGLFGPSVPVTQDDAVFAIATVRQLLDAAQDAEEQGIAKEQANNKLNIYVVISSKRLHTVFERPQAEFRPYLSAADGAKTDDLRREVLELVNAERARAGVEPLAFHDELNLSAQSYAEEMADDGFFSHVSPTGKTLKDRIRASGYYDRSYSEDCRCVKGYALGENLARGQRTPEEAVAAWMASPSHREAMLSADYGDTGIGIAAGLWVQHFGGVLEPTEVGQRP